MIPQAEGCIGIIFCLVLQLGICDRGSRVIQVSDHDLPCREFEPSTTKDPPCRAAITLNLSRAETSSRWCGVIVRRGGASSGVVHVT
ncbi:hypothetical protein TNCV_4040171 [Trichonephila clavipes]|nr:hypothetical protein TNCV_4040171 [Trichonephila clavipes]